MCTRPLTALTLLTCLACQGVGDGGSATIVDHHVHILSPQLVKDWQATGVRFSRPDSVYTSASILLRPPEAEGRPSQREIAGAILIPMAHVYGRADFRGPLRLSLTAEAQRVSLENDYVAAEAARYPGRAIALCSVDFLRPYAWDEVQRCRTELQSPGIKLHLGSARANLTYQSHLAALGRIAGFADREGMVLLLHFDPQSDRADPADVERFIATVLQPHPTLTVVIAHMGGSGSYGPWTRVIMRTFQDWLDTEAEAGRPRPGVYFDISAVWLARDSEGLPRTSRQEIEAIAEDLTRYGVGRLLFGSDYPTFDPRAYAAGFRRTIGLSPEAWDTLARNRLPPAATATPP